MQIDVRVPIRKRVAAFPLPPLRGWGLSIGP